MSGSSGGGRPTARGSSSGGGRGSPLPDVGDLAGLGDAVLANLPDARRPWRPSGERPRIGFVFGAGGVLGNAYLGGAIAALHEATGFEPREAWVLVGTSAGAVHAALFGAGMPALFALWRNRGGILPAEALAERAGWGDPENPGALLDDDEGEVQNMKEIFTPARALPKIGPASKTLLAKAMLRPWAYRPELVLSALLPEGVLTNAAIGRALRRVVPTGWVAHPRTWITAVNLRTGGRAVFGRPGAPRAHLDRAVRASCAIPGLYRPVRIGRDRYIDGGIHSPSNADLVGGLDLDLVVVINPMSALEGHAATGFVDRYLFPLRHFASRRLAAELRGLHDRDLPVLAIQPSSTDLAVFSRNLMDARPRREVAETAVVTTREALADPRHASALTLLRLAAQNAVRPDASSA